jgi:CRP-like cAMP-binding protein
MTAQRKTDTRGVAADRSGDRASRPTRQDLLSRVFLFAGLSEEELDAVAEYAVSKKFPARRQIFHKGDQGTEAYAIVSGRLKVVTESSDGKEAILSIMEPGEVFGEVAMLCGGRRSATVQTLERSELLVLHRRDLLAVFDKHPAIAVSCLAALAERLVRITETMEDVMFRGLPSRLARRLLALADAYGEEQGDDVRIDLRLSQSELAGMVGTSRESVNKQIKTWEREGWVSHDRGEVVLHDRAALEELADLAGF